MTPALAAQLSQGANHSVIVIMRNRLSGADAANDQAPVMGELRQVNAARVKAFRMVNSLAAQVSDGELQRLKANPAVAEVIPDVVIHRRPTAAAIAARKQKGPPTSLPLNVIPGACGSNGKVQLDPEGLQTTNTDSDDPQAKTARSLGFTGAGVKVAYIADGIDTQNVNFIRANGRSVFVDYQDFSGDGPGQPTAGGEAFIDSNAIAGQGIHVYNVSGFTAEPDPAACRVRIEGMAPGVSLVGLDVFGSFEDTTESNFLEAIEYAVTVDHVDVLNESFGGNPFPDQTSTDATKLFNEAAVRAGTTVTVSSGDAGVNNTIGSPGTDPNVIDVGASTTFRFYAQTNYAAARYFATTGWLNNNISALSSGGFDQSGGTIDLVAPGDLAWASCDASPNFSDCTDFAAGNPSNIESSGGTSLSSPLTAGAAALVIQAYRSSHRGASPSPSLVKQIITSTATDLGLPATEQGAGLLNVYKAVLLAQSINVARPGSGQALLLSQSQLNAVASPGSSQSWSVNVSNPSGVGQSVQVSGRTFGPDENVQTGSIALSDATSPEFEGPFGNQDDYGVFHFTVSKSADRLTASIAFMTTGQLSLVDPQGRFAGYSLPQGPENSAVVDVRSPAAGVWTGIIFGASASAGGSNGTVLWRTATQRFAPFASVTPSSFFLPPGQSQTLRVSATLPSTPGDASGSIVLSSSGGGTDAFLGSESNSIPVTLRSLVNVNNGGAFSGVLIGGNGRTPFQIGQVAYYQFNIGPGHSSVTANVSLTNDSGDIVGSYLVNPEGVAVGFAQNNGGATNSRSLSAYAVNPDAGTWTLIVDFTDPVVGDEITQRFTGNILLDNVFVNAPALPGNRRVRLAAGVPVTIPVTITNNGPAAEQYFLDARLNATANMTLTTLAPPANIAAGYALPLGSTADPATPIWLVPTQVSRVQVLASATLPVEFEFSPFPGDPDLFAPPLAHNQAVGTYAPAGSDVSPGVWSANPTELGPYSGPAPPGFVQMNLVATGNEFDATVTSDTGDLWQAALDPSTLATFAPITINPHQSAVIDVTITPSGSSGQVVNGILYVDDAVGDLPPYGQLTGDQLAAIPYSYTIQ
jgi:hypothetical protein